jgi:hypothetical protein
VDDGLDDVGGGEADVEGAVDVDLELGLGAAEGGEAAIVTSWRWRRSSAGRE